MTPRATARLQLHAGFTLADAQAQVDYYAALSISHLYLSPVTRARAGSTHGYDVIDHGAVDPALGGEAALRALAQAARAQGMGLVLDIVPNHMAVHADNAWWWDVLQHGPASAHAGTFDIDWRPADPDLAGKVHLPVLGQAYGACLARGDLTLAHDDARGYVLRAHDAPYPVAPGTLAPAGTVAETLAHHDPSSPCGRTRLHALLQAQHYRLAWWRTAPDQINWRRFFEITELAGVRVEDPAIFDAVHSLVLRLYAEGIVEGLRIDHIDGLADPGGYAHRLREAMTRARPDVPPYIVVEKILAEDEILPGTWRVAGTSGYDFMDQVGALLHAPQARTVLDEGWRALTGDARSPRVQWQAARHRMITRHFPAERAALVRCLLRLARLDPCTRDWSAVAIDRALSAVLVAFPVYRSYADARGRDAADAAVCQQAWRDARVLLDSRPGDPAHDLLPVLDAWLGGTPLPSDPATRALREEALRRFQQLTPPLAAKALEDTLFYRHGPLLSRNEVGAAPGALSLPPARFLALARIRGQDFPGALLATATHDHKRGEDVRARLASATEDAATWHDTLSAWTRDWHVDRPGKDAPLPADRYMLLQTLVGAWPVGLSPDDAKGVADFIGRVGAWQEKALREAKLRTDWYAPDTDYEAACAAFLQAIADTPARLAALSRQVDALAGPGMINGLSQTLLRHTVPGVPDLYQGRESWDFSLVDPDNRREVDYAALRQGLANPPAATDVHAWTDGRIKQALVQRCLAHRQSQAALYAAGELQPLAVAGTRSANILAFLRRHGPARLLVVVPLHCTQTMPCAGAKPGQVTPASAAYWGDTRIVLDDTDRPAQAWDILHDVPVAIDGDLPVHALLREWPVAAWQWRQAG